MKTLWQKKDNLKGSDRPGRAGTVDIEGLFSRNAAGLWRFFLRRSGEESQTEDLMQELCLQLARTDPPIGGDDLHDAWLFGVARNVWRNYLRSMVRRRNNIPLASGDGLELVERIEQGVSPEEELACEESRRELMMAITALPGIDQEIIKMHYFDGISQRDIASEMDMSERAVEGRLYRARQALKAKLADNDF